MTLTIILFILGFVFLLKGADILVDGSSSIAKRFGVSSFFIGLTIVAFGTSTPELVISTLASIKGSSEIALGNIIGANISNTLLILGICAIITPLIVKRVTVNKAIPFSLLAILVVGILVNDFLIERILPNGLTRIDGLILILFFGIFIYYTFGITKDKENIFQKTVGELKQEELKEYSRPMSVIMIVVGLAGLTIGGHWVVSGAIKFAEIFKVSETLLGLSVLALGTTLPELSTSAMAAYRGKTDIAMGNIVGSNIFNLLFVLGVSSTIKPINFNPVFNTDIAVLLSITVMLLFLIYIGKKNILGKWEGSVLLSLYACYLVFLIYRG